MSRMTSPNPHDTPISEGYVGTVADVAPPWQSFGPVSVNVDASGATRENGGFPGTPTGGFTAPPPSDPHSGAVSREPGGWRVPK